MELWPLWCNHNDPAEAPIRANRCWQWPNTACHGIIAFTNDNKTTNVVQHLIRPWSIIRSGSFRLNFNVQKKRRRWCLVATYNHWIPCWLSHLSSHCEQWLPCTLLSERWGPVREQKHFTLTTADGWNGSDSVSLWYDHVGFVSGTTNCSPLNNSSAVFEWNISLRGKSRKVTTSQDNRV